MMRITKIKRHPARAIRPTGRKTHKELGKQKVNVMKRFYFISLISFIFIFAFILPAHAHHLWVALDDAGDYVVSRGHAPDKTEAYNPAAVGAIAAFDAGGGRITVERIDDADRVRLRTDSVPAVVTVVCDWGYRVNTTQGKRLITRQQAREQGMRVLSTFFSTQFCKTLFADGPAATRSAGMAFEIIPLKSPFQLKPGELLPFRLTFNDRPLAEAVVTIDHPADKVTTDADGAAGIKIADHGLQVISVSHQVPTPDDPEKDYHRYTTFLIFEVKK
jgi:nickel transport protein